MAERNYDVSDAKRRMIAMETELAERRKFDAEFYERQRRLDSAEPVVAVAVSAMAIAAALFFG